MQKQEQEDEKCSEGTKLQFGGEQSSAFKGCEAHKNSRYKIYEKEKVTYADAVKTVI